MGELQISGQQIGPMSEEAIDRVRRLEAETLKMPQVDLAYDHVLHGGVYARSTMLPAGMLLTSVPIKIPTILIVQGDAMIYVGTDQPIHVLGYRVLPAAAGRKSAVYARLDTWMTMLCRTNATSVAEVEAELTDEADRLSSRRRAANNHIRITGGRS